MNRVQAWLKYARARLAAAREERGQAVFLIMALAMPLFMIGGVAVVDTGGVVVLRRDLQSTADLASLAGVVELPNQTAATAASLEWLTRNGFSAGSPGESAEITFPAEGRLRVQLRSNYDSIFASFIGRDGWTVGAAATAAMRRQPAPYSLFALGHNCPTMTNGGNSTLNIVGGATYNGGTCSNALDGFGTMGLHATRHDVVGGVVYGSNTTITPPPRTGASTREDPFAHLTPPTVPSGTCPSVSFTGQTGGTLSPGCYNSISVTGGGTINVQPGIYIIKGGSLSIGGTASFTSNGGEVLFYLTCSPSPCNGATRNFNYNGSQLFSLVGHSDYDNVVFWIDRTAAPGSTMTLNGNANFDVQGSIYHYNGQVQLGGTSNAPLRLSVVSNTFRLAGGANLTIEWGEDWAPMEEFPVLVE